jgi:hypothetical protein
MGALSVFLKQNKKEKGNVKFAASSDFADEKGKPVEWEIRPLKSREADHIRNECTQVNNKGRKINVDGNRFNLMVAAKCTIFPNLNDKDLQDSYGVMGAEALLQELLDNDGDYQAYCKKVLEVSGYAESDEELVEEAKN